MPDDFQRIYTELESIQAQLRSMAASIASNTVEIGQRVMNVEAWRDGHEKVTDLRVEAIELRFSNMQEAIDTLSIEVGKEVGATNAKVAAHERLIEQMRGAATVWRIVLSVLGGVLLILNLWHNGGVK